MAGYSKTPLWKKLGIKEQFSCHLYHAPLNYFDMLEEIPDESIWDEDFENSPYDFIHVFITDLISLQKGWDIWKSKLKKNGILWISWPKVTSGKSTDLNGNRIRAFGLSGGLVDVKVCAIDDTWSGLKFMYRRKDR